MDDHTAIRRTIVRYGQSIDDRDPDSLVSLYAADGTHSANGNVYRGHDEIRGWITGAFPRIANLRHLVLGSNIEVYGDTARAVSDWMTVRRTDDDGVAMQSVGRFDDTFARVDGDWVFTSRTLHRFAGSKPAAAPAS